MEKKCKKKPKGFFPCPPAANSRNESLKTRRNNGNPRREGDEIVTNLKKVHGDLGVHTLVVRVEGNQTKITLAGG